MRFTHMEDMEAHIASMKKIDEFLTVVVENFDSLGVCRICLAAELEEFAKYLRGEEFCSAEDSEMNKAFVNHVASMLGRFK